MGCFQTTIGVINRVTDRFYLETPRKLGRIVGRREPISHKFVRPGVCVEYRVVDRRIRPECGLPLYLVVTSF